MEGAPTDGAPAEAERKRQRACCSTAGQGMRRHRSLVVTHVPDAHAPEAGGSQAGGE